MGGREKWGDRELERGGGRRVVVGRGMVGGREESGIVEGQLGEWVSTTLSMMAFVAMIFQLECIQSCHYYQHLWHLAEQVRV